MCDSEGPISGWASGQCQTSEGNGQGPPKPLLYGDSFVIKIMDGYPLPYVSMEPGRRSGGWPERTNTLSDVLEIRIDSANKKPVDSVGKQVMFGDSVIFTVSASSDTNGYWVITMQRNPCGLWNRSVGMNVSTVSGSCTNQGMRILDRACGATTPNIIPIKYGDYVQLYNEKEEQVWISTPIPVNCGIFPSNWAPCSATALDQLFQIVGCDTTIPSYDSKCLKPTGPTTCPSGCPPVTDSSTCVNTCPTTCGGCSGPSPLLPSTNTCIAGQCDSNGCRNGVTNPECSPNGLWDCGTGAPSGFKKFLPVILIVIALILGGFFIFL